MSTTNPTAHPVEKVGAAGATVAAQIVIDRHGAVGERHVQAVAFGIVVEIPGLHGERNIEDRRHVTVGLGAEHTHRTRQSKKRRVLEEAGPRQG